MFVGLHEAIQGVGQMPSTLNAGTQVTPTLYGAVNGL